MKNLKITLVALALALGFSSTVVAQDSSAVAVDGGVDIYSSYIWRGAKFGTGAAFQPFMEGTIGNLSVGAWGSVNSGADEALEMDLYVGYSFDFGLGLTVTDYYFGGDWTAYDLNHFIEPSVSYEIGNFSIMGAYMFTPDFEDGDTYIEAGYSLGALDIAIGAGDGAYSADGEFDLCNITLGTSKDIEITDKFSLPISSSVTLNPSSKAFFITAGVSF